MRQGSIGNYFRRPREPSGCEGVHDSSLGWAGGGRKVSDFPLFHYDSFHATVELVGSGDWLAFVVGFVRSAMELMA